jgi:hypothetical protein
MGVGLVSLVRRVWAPRGVKVRQKVQMVREWRYLVAAVDVVAGRIWWCWTDRVNGETMARVVGSWQQRTDLDGVVWDGATSHRGAAVWAWGFPLVVQPPYAPELNPAERLIEELRRAVEGRVYASLDPKVEAIEQDLQTWDANQDRVRRLAGWPWIVETLRALPQPSLMAA